MRLTISKSKNAEQLYITKSIRVDKNKTTSKIIVKLGSMASLLPQHDNDRDKVIAWAKEQARIYTEAEKTNTLKIPVEFSEGKQLSFGEQATFNGGYLFLQNCIMKSVLTGSAATSVKNIALNMICRQSSRGSSFQGSFPRLQNCPLMNSCST